MKQDRNGWGLDCDAERTRWVRRYRTSGLGLKRFAEQHGLKATQLHYWVYGAKQPRACEAPAPLFREVRLPTPVTRPASWSAEIGLPDGTSVRLVGATDVAWTLALVEALRRPCSR